MSYQVLARKYRPKTFAEMVGQEHALRALINALDQQRLHHAYLFTGTRGVGKTTLARLLAKCFNCVEAVSSEPCEICHACREINLGSFIDLIEVDAASRTKVEDTRELLDNVQYAPSSGRYKVYLIDEVHMLSGHSFNALLKTLEEPPPHVKFLLATTDPQRLPITVLSRCLQFNLKNLAPEKIQAQLANILQQEELLYEPSALQQLAAAANGSLRDALSLLDQAIPFSNGKITAADVHLMLGTIEQHHVVNLLQALAEQNPLTLITQLAALAEHGADFAKVLEEIISTLHELALIQVLPAVIEQRQYDSEKLLPLAKQFTPEDIQLFYQIALTGRRDLPLAPSTRIGLEMTLLRMLAFTPTDSQPEKNVNQPKTPALVSPPTITPDAPVTQRSQQSSSQAPAIINSAVLSFEVENWDRIIPALNLSGFTLALAMHCVIQRQTEGLIHLSIDPVQSALSNPKQTARLAEALSGYLNKQIKLQITPGSPGLSTPARTKQLQQSNQLDAATLAIHNDANVNAIIETFAATITTDSIQIKNPVILASDND